MNARRIPRAAGAAQTRREFIGSALALSGALGLRRLLSARRADAAASEDGKLTLDQLDDSGLEAEVCIIGSGPAGAILACSLVDRGIDTLLIESGAEHGGRDGAATAGLDAYRAAGEIDYRVASTRFRGAGGTSNLWTGNCPRFHPCDFEPNAYTPPGAPWPIRYADLEAYYLRAEIELRVQGVDGAPFAPLRREPFPRPLTSHTPNLRRLLAGAETEIVLEPLPRSAAQRERPANVALTHLPAYRSSPHGTLVCGATATDILTDDDGRVTGVRVQSLGQPARLARARTYVVACGGIESARLLLLSRGPRFPAGIGNHGDLVGRYFTEHPAVLAGKGRVRGLWDPRSKNEGAYCENFVVEAKEMGLGGVRLRVRATRPPVEPQLRHPWESLLRGIRAFRQLDLDVKAEIEMEPAAGNRVALDESVRDAFDNPGASLSLGLTQRDRRTILHCEDLVRRVLEQLGAEDITVEVGLRGWGHHHMGACRMGDDPNTSVVDRDLRVHGCENLYVAGSAPFVTTSVSNPTLTIVALSLRLADHLADKRNRDEHG